MSSNFFSGKRSGNAGASGKPAPKNPVQKTSTLVTKPGARSVPCGPCSAKKGKPNG